jgi:hypothetical protein
MDQFRAAREGDLQKLRDALTVGNVNRMDVVGFTALHFGRIECMKYCLDMHANVNNRNKYGSAQLRGFVNPSHSSKTKLLPLN